MMIKYFFGQRFRFMFSSNQPHKEVKITYDYVYGINPVMAALHAQKRKFEELYLYEGQENHVINPRLTNIINYANSIHLPIKLTLKNKLENMVGQGQPHQNIVLKCATKKFLRVENINEVKSDVIIFFDQITDPQNFGSIIRSAFFLGIKGFIVEEKNRCPLTSTISKVSSGALEMVDIHSVNNSLQFLKNAQSQGYLVISTGFNQQKKMISTKSNMDIPSDKVVIIFGSESVGVSSGLINLSDLMIQVPAGEQRKFPETLVDSLNVGVTAGIIMHKILDCLKK